jgi:hypothetical protein
VYRTHCSRRVFPVDIEGFDVIAGPFDDMMAMAVAANGLAQMVLDSHGAQVFWERRQVGEKHYAVQTDGKGGPVNNSRLSLKPRPRSLRLVDVDPRWR